DPIVEHGSLFCALVAWVAGAGEFLLHQRVAHVLLRGLPIRTHDLIALFVQERFPATRFQTVWTGVVSFSSDGVGDLGDDRFPFAGAASDSGRDNTPRWVRNLDPILIGSMLVFG